ncbi:hypothetical protein FDUTEX481_09611 [Tolypothrix sp. PCC 7601]|nr:hypothetical protein FDUTEX481_09611 [Tolypothrix sp. PCC 7601]
MYPKVVSLARDFQLKKYSIALLAEEAEEQGAGSRGRINYPLPITHYSLLITH